MKPACAICGPSDISTPNPAASKRLRSIQIMPTPLHLMGLLSVHAQQYDHAVEWLARAIRQNAKPEYLFTLGRTLQLQGRLEDALKTFDKAIQLKPDDAELWKNLGDVLVDLKRPQDALLSFQQTLKLNPLHWHAARRCGLLLHELGRPVNALSYLDLAHNLQPDHPAVLELRARVLFGLRRFEEAVARLPTGLCA